MSKKSAHYLNSANYEHQVVIEHMRTHPKQKAYHWTKLPHQHLLDSGYVYDFKQFRELRIKYKKENPDANFLPDMGLDGISCHYENPDDETPTQFFGLQAKFYEKKTVGESNLTTFFDVIKNRLQKKNSENGGFVYSSTNLTKSVQKIFAKPENNLHHVQFNWNPDNNITYQPRYVYYSTRRPKTQRQAHSGAGASSSDDDSDVTDEDEENYTNQIENTKEYEYELHDYQKSCLDELVNTYNEDTTSLQLLHLAPGLGKTKLCGHFLQRITNLPKIIVIIAPLKISVQNIRYRLRQYFNAVNIDFSEILIDSESDGTTDEMKLREFLDDSDEEFESLSDKKTKIIYSTFTSAINVVAKVLTLPNHVSSIFDEFDYDICEVESETSEFSEEFYDDCMIIVDEAHNLLNRDELCEFINRFPAGGLLMTGTSTHQLQENLRINNEIAVSIGESIKNGYLCDYEIWLPLLKDGELGEEREVDLNIPNIFEKLPNRDLTQKALFLQTSLLMTGSRKTIVYVSSHAEADEFLTILTEIMQNPEYQNLRFWGAIIDSRTSSSQRNQLLNEFQSSDIDCEIFRVLVSIRVLDEAVNIPACDSVFITNLGDKSCELRFVQRIMRASRIDRDNPSKKNHVFVWATGNEKQLQVLRYLRDDDADLVKKIRVKSSKYDVNLEQFGEMIEKKNAYQRQIDTIVCGAETFDERLMKNIDLIAKFYADHGRKPTSSDIRDKFEKYLARVLVKLLVNYRNNRLSSKIINYCREQIPWFTLCKKPDQMKIYEERLIAIRNYYNEHGKYPSQYSRYKQIQNIAIWISIIKTKQNRLKPELRELILKYFDESFFEKKDDTYLKECEQRLIQIRNYYDLHGKFPNSNSKDVNEEFLGNWISTLKNKIKPELRELILKYFDESFFEKKDDKYLKECEQRLIQIRNYYDLHGKLPSSKSKDLIFGSFGKWITRLKNKIKPELRELILKYFDESFFEKSVDLKMKKYEEKLIQIKQYYDQYGKYPSHASTDKQTRSLGQWIQDRKKINRTSPELRELILKYFDESFFVKEYDKYLKEYEQRLIKIRKYYNENNKFPSSESKDIELKKLGVFISGFRNSKTNTQEFVDLFRSYFPDFEFKYPPKPQ